MKRSLKLLIGWGGLSALVYGLVLAAFPMWALYRVRHGSLSTLLPVNLPTGLLLASLVLVLLVGYMSGYRLLQRLEPNRPTLLVVTLFPLLFVALLLWVQPISSVDLYDYLFRGRMLAHYGANPFTAIPEQFATDPMIDFIGWRKAVTAYGPLWELMSWGAAWLAGGDLLRLLFSYKMLAVLSYVLCAWVLWWNWDSRTAQQRMHGLYLWLWNPLILWEVVGMGHNDGWLALALIVTALALLRQRYRLALVALVAGALIKFLPLLLIPVVLLAMLRWVGWRAFGQGLLGLGLGGLLAAAAYTPFWAGLATFANIYERQPLWHGAPLALARQLAAQQLGVVVNPWEAWPGGWLTLAMLGIVVGLVLLLLLFRRMSGPMALLLTFWLVLYFANPWFQPWYVIWIIALVCCLPDNEVSLRMAHLFASTALLSYLASAFLLPQLGWSGEGLAWQAFFVAFVYLLPLLPLLRRLPLGRVPLLRWRGAPSRLAKR